MTVSTEAVSSADYEDFREPVSVTTNMQKVTVNILLCTVLSAVLISD